GGANNQLESDELGTELDRRGILYAPDYAINAGGLMSSALELQGFSQARAQRHVGRIYGIISRILELASREKIPTWQAARKLAEQRLASISRTKLSYLGPP
ncbi:MAG: leucine dehydrogenase, partial [Xanthomonadaceae bacterium]|nr:leucine dehydrogenase [Xanthomonadaceae bacterium]